MPAMNTPHEAFRQILDQTGDPMAAIKTIREDFGLTVPEAKEVWLQVTQQVSSLSEHQARLVDAVNHALDKIEP